MMTLAVTFVWRKISKLLPSSSSTSMKMRSTSWPGVSSQDTLSRTDPTAAITWTSGQVLFSARRSTSRAGFSSSMISAFI